MPVPRPSKRARSFEEAYADIERLPENLTGEILVPGVVSAMPRAGVPHQHAVKMIEDALNPWDPRHGGTGWWIFAELEIRLPGDRLAVPDLAGWRVDRVARMPDENPLTVLPDWCAEVLSPNTAAVDRAVKLPLYAKCGIGHVWLVDPSLRLVEVYETSRERPTLVATARDAETLALPPFGEIPVAPWWRDAENPAV